MAQPRKLIQSFRGCSISKSLSAQKTYGAIVVAEQEGEKLFIADVMAQKIVTLQEIIRELPFTGIRRIYFGFCPDWLGVVPEWKPIDMDKEPFFIRGDWHLPAKYRFPILSET